MQADKEPNFIAQLISADRRADCRRASRAFSRWARGGMNPGEVSGPTGAARRGLAEATRPQSAQAILEFLLVSVPLLAMLFGILEFGLAFFESTNLDFTTREVARTVAVCAGGCDNFSAGGTVVYRDFDALQKVEQFNMNLDNVEYMLIQHVGEDVDDPAINPDGSGTPIKGRAGPDTYANYKFQYQLYAPSKVNFAATDLRKNSVPARATNPSNLRMADALPSQIPLLNGSGFPYNATINANYNGYRSNRCPTNPPSAASECRTNIPEAKADGTVDNTRPARPVWSGRYLCYPTDRLYVQIVYRHNWITPFLPTVNLNGRSQTLRGFSNQDALYLSSKIYEKVEPQLFSNGSC